MKIGVITYSLFSHGGVQRVTSTILNSLSENNNVEIIYIGKLEYCKEYLYGLNEEVISINRKKIEINLLDRAIRKATNIINSNSRIFNSIVSSTMLEKLLYPKKMKNDLIEYLNRQNYDIIIASEGEITLLLASIADKINAKTIGWQHNSYDAYYNTYKRYCWNKTKLSVKLLARLDRIVVLTDDDKIKYKNNMNIDTIRIYNPLSFSSSKKSECLNKNIITVGRLVEQKGFNLLIEAFNRIVQNNEEWTLTIVGEGPEKGKLISLLNKYDLTNRVKIESFTNKIEDYYLDSSIFVSSSIWEGFGLVIIEAMECGLPVIAFENSGPKEIINKQNINGILVRNYDVIQLANEIINLMEDDEKRKRMSLESIETAKDFNVNNIIKQWIEIIENLEYL